MIFFVNISLCCCIRRCFIYLSFLVCTEGLETLTVVLALYPPALESLTKDPQFHKMILSLVVSAKEKLVRTTAVEQMLLIATKCSLSGQTLVLFIAMLFNVLNGRTKTYSKEYFQVSFLINSFVSIQQIKIFFVAIVWIIKLGLCFESDFTKCRSSSGS